MEESQKMLECYRAKGMQLAEKWSRLPGKTIRGFDSKIDFLEGIDDDYKRAVMSQLYENTLNWLGSLDESTRMLSVGSFEKFVFPIIRAIMANLVASELVTVHPLDAPTGLVFYFDVLYGSSKGNISRGTKMYDSRFGPSTAYHYTDEIIQEEALNAGDGVTTTFTGTLGYTPVRAGTVVITNGTLRVVDNGNGGLQGDVAVDAASNTINYVTGAYSVHFSAAPAANSNITADYEYNSEANANIPELDLQLSSAPVTARTNKLRARWSIEAQQDFQAYHGVNAEVEIVSFMANEIAKELNYKVIQHINAVASGGDVTWDRTPPAGVPWIWHKESLYDSLVMGSNSIFSRTQRVGGTWVVAGVNVCNVIETMSKFQGSGSSSGAGIRKIGKIGEFDVYKDPTFDSDKWLMGHKGNNFLDTGYIYAPYLALYTTGTVVLDDMLARKGMAQRTGLKVVNSAFYSRGSVDQSGGAFGD